MWNRKRERDPFKPCRQGILRLCVFCFLSTLGGREVCATEKGHLKQAEVNMEASLEASHRKDVSQFDGLTLSFDDTQVVKTLNAGQISKWLETYVDENLGEEKAYRQVLVVSFAGNDGTYKDSEERKDCSKFG